MMIRLLKSYNIIVGIMLMVTQISLPLVILGFGVCIWEAASLCPLKRVMFGCP
jgi:hypothetical protein